MEIIEKVKEVEKTPTKEYASKGVAGAGLGLGIAGTALGLLALNRGGFGLFGNNCGCGYGNCGMPQNVNINADVNNGANGVAAPTAFMAWEKECDDAIALTSAMYNGRITDIREKQAAREIDVNEKFQIWKSQVDGDFGLYKSTRDEFDVLSAKQNRDAFNLYKSQRDADDAISQRISNLESRVAVNEAIRPYQDKLIQCEIDKAFTAGINYTDRKTCKMITGRVVLPSTPTVTGYGSYCCCSNAPVTAATAE